MSTDRELPGYVYRAGMVRSAPLRIVPVNAVYTKAVDTRKLSVTAVLTFPVIDLAGDDVKPDGGNWREHKASPWVGYEHLRWSRDRSDWGLLGQRGIGTEPVVVAWARESLGKSGAPHTVEHKSIVIDGERHTLPVGTSYFDPSDRLSAQTFALVEQDALPGVSLEFRPVEKARRVRMARSPLENRPAYCFDQWDGLAWTHCRTPVNPGAMVCKAVDAGTEKLIRALTDKRIGTEAIHPLLFKSLSRSMPVRPSRTTVRVENKAMPDPNDQQTAYDAVNTEGADTGDVTQDGDGGRPLNGVEAFYAKVQRMGASCEEFLSDMEASDSPELRSAAKKVCGKVQKIAEWAKGFADKHDAKLSGKAPAEGESEDGDEDEDEEETEPEDGDDDADMETDDDGAFKSVRAAYKPRQRAYHKALAARVRRIPLAEVQKAQTVAAATVDVQPAPAAVASPEDTEYLKAALEAEALADKQLRRARRNFA